MQGNAASVPRRLVGLRSDAVFSRALSGGSETPAASGMLEREETLSAQPQIIPDPAPAASSPQASQHSLIYAWYVVGVLMLAYVFSFIDRQIFSMVVGPLRHDLHISDSQVGYLQGLSFVVFYTFFGILIGRLVDIYSRRTIIAIGLVLWSLFTT